MLDKLKILFSSTIGKAITVVALTAALPLTVFLTQQQQDIRQRAQSIDICPYPSCGPKQLNSLPQSVHTYQYGSVVTNGFLFALGTTNTQSLLFSTKIQDKGAVDNWQTLSPPITGPLTADLRNFLFAHNNNLFLIGSINQNQTVQYVFLSSHIQDDGTVGQWKSLQSPASLIQWPQYLTLENAFVYNGKIYILGGQYFAAPIENYIFSASINQDGSIGEWNKETRNPYNNPPDVPLRPGIITENGFLITPIFRDGKYFISSMKIDNNTIVTQGTIYSQPLPSPWTIVRNIYSTTTNTVYLLATFCIPAPSPTLGIGECKSINYSVFSATLNPDGSFGSWKQLSLPSDSRINNFYNSAATTYNNYLFVIGEQSDNNYLPNVFSIPLTYSPPNTSPFPSITPQKLKTYSNSQYGFSFEYPADLTYTEEFINSPAKQVLPNYYSMRFTNSKDEGKFYTYRIYKNLVDIDIFKANEISMDKLVTGAMIPKDKSTWKDIMIGGVKGTYIEEEGSSDELHVYAVFTTQNYLFYIHFLKLQDNNYITSDDFKALLNSFSIIDSSQTPSIPKSCQTLYEKWKSYIGSTSKDGNYCSSVDFNNDGVVDILDYGIWRNHAADTTWCSNYLAKSCSAEPTGGPSNGLSRPAVVSISSGCTTTNPYMDFHMTLSGQVAWYHFYRTEIGNSWKSDWKTSQYIGSMQGNSSLFRDTPQFGLKENTTYRYRIVAQKDNNTTGAYSDPSDDYFPTSPLCSSQNRPTTPPPCATPSGGVPFYNLGGIPSPLPSPCQTASPTQSVTSAPTPIISACNASCTQNSDCAGGTGNTCTTCIQGLCKSSATSPAPTNPPPNQDCGGFDIDQTSCIAKPGCKYIPADQACGTAACIPQSNFVVCAGGTGPTPTYPVSPPNQSPATKDDSYCHQFDNNTNACQSNGCYSYHTLCIAKSGNNCHLIGGQNAATCNAYGDICTWVDQQGCVAKNTNGAGGIAGFFSGVFTAAQTFIKNTLPFLFK